MAPDEMDRVQEQTAQFNADALTECFRRGIRNTMNAPTHCVNCEEEIPVARRRAVPGTSRCIVCQADYELLAHWR